MHIMYARGLHMLVKVASVHFWEFDEESISCDDNNYCASVSLYTYA